MTEAGCESLCGGGEHGRRRTRWGGDGFLPWAVRYLPTICFRSCGHGRRASLQRKRSLVAVIVLGGMLVLVLGLLSGVSRRGVRARGLSEDDRSRVFSLEWRTLIPELSPLMEELRECGRQVRETFDNIQIEHLFACDTSPEEGPFSPECVKEAQRHLDSIRNPSDEALRWYRRNDEARARRWPHGRPPCKAQTGSHRAYPEQNGFVGHEPVLGGANASVWVGDFAPCATAQDRYIVYLRHNASHEPALRASALRIVSRAELEGQQNGKVLVVLNGLVLDVSSFLDQHPGGPSILRSMRGKDATAMFESIHSSFAREMSHRLVIGRAPPPGVVPFLPTPFHVASLSLQLHQEKKTNKMYR